MSSFQFSQVPSLGATPAVPKLLPGNEWFQYLDASGRQLTSCPSAAVQAGRGCYMINGYAYGQRRAYMDEFVKRPSLTPLGPAAACYQHYKDWLAQNPNHAACANDDSLKQYVTICLAVESGELSPSTGTSRWTKYVNRTMCKTVNPPPPPPPAKKPPPSSTKPPAVPPPAKPPAGRPVDPPPALPTGNDFNAPPPPVTQHKPSVLQQLGPIVGIGLLAAIALTAARQMKKKGKAKHKRR